MVLSEPISRRSGSWLQMPGCNILLVWFNPETARNEMVNFWAVLFNQVAVDKFLHTISSGFACIYVRTWNQRMVSDKKQGRANSKKSILVAGYSAFIFLNGRLYGDQSTRTVSKVQPVKFASMEALYEGKNNAGLIAFGVLKDTDKK